MPPSVPLPRRRRHASALVAALLLTSAAVRAQSAPPPAAPPAAGAATGVRQLAELTAAQVRALDRARTVVIIPGGVIEEHGPYLPVESDGYFNERLARALADGVAARPGWTALVLPLVPLGTETADAIGGRASFPGSVTVRFATLRAVFLDLASALGAQGFRWVFVVHGHGGPNHNRALDQAGDFFHDAYGGWMVNLVGLQPVYDAWSGEQSAAEAAEDAHSVHAGLNETSSLLFLRPDLVDAGYRSAPSLTDTTVAGLGRFARRADWPGYFGAPRLATAERGASDFARVRAAALAQAFAVLGGADPRRVPRYADLARGDAGIAAVDRRALAADARREARQQAWLRRKMR